MAGEPLLEGEAGALEDLRIESLRVVDHDDDGSPRGELPVRIGEVAIVSGIAEQAVREAIRSALS